MAPKKKTRKDVGYTTHAATGREQSDESSEEAYLAHHHTAIGDREEASAEVDPTLRDARYDLEPYGDNTDAFRETGERLRIEDTLKTAVEVEQLAHGARDKATRENERNAAVFCARELHWHWEDADGVYLNGSW